MRIKQQHLTELREILNRYFTEENLRDLCFDLGIDYETFDNDTKSSIARELVMYCSRVNRIPELIERGQKVRPNVEWPVVARFALTTIPNTKLNWFRTIGWMVILLIAIPISLFLGSWWTRTPSAAPGVIIPTKSTTIEKPLIPVPDTFSSSEEIREDDDSDRSNIVPPSNVNSRVPSNVDEGQFFPNSTEIAAGLTANQIIFHSPESLANNSSERALFNSWERLDTYERFYTQPNPCNSTNGIELFYIQLSFFESDYGSDQFFRWAHDGFNVTLDDSIGNQAYIYENVVPGECQLNVYSITLQRHNVIYRVRVRSAATVANRADIASLVKQWALWGDQQILRNANQ